MMKLVNPLYSPMAVLAGGIALVAGVRFAKVPSVVMVPVSMAIATAGAAVLAPQSMPTRPRFNPALDQELTNLLAQAQKLAKKAESLKGEAAALLDHSLQIDLLGTVQFACDRTMELPQKIEAMTRRLQGDDSILSVQELQQQREALQGKLASSSAVTRQQLEQLDQRLQRNIELARQGQDARQAQLLSLSQVIAESAGVLQSMQNQLRNANLKQADQTSELQTLSNELREFQDNLDVLVLT